MRPNQAQSIGEAVAYELDRAQLIDNYKKLTDGAFNSLAAKIDSFEIEAEPFGGRTTVSSGGTGQDHPSLGADVLGKDGPFLAFGSDHAATTWADASDSVRRLKTYRCLSDSDGSSDDDDHPRGRRLRLFR